MSTAGSLGPGGRRFRPLAAAVVGALLAASCAAADPQKEGPALPGGRKVVLLGLDGADWQAVDALVARGRLPTFARLMAGGRTGILRATPPLLSPILWTTLATGRPPDEHGVLDFMEDLPSGGQAPVGSPSRRVPALWSLFSHHGRRVAVVGWWATFPAETVNGTIVSDRVAPQLLRADAVLDPRAISPEGRGAALSASLVRAADVSRDDLARYVPVTPREWDAARAALHRGKGRLYEDRLAHLAAVVAGTRTYGAMAATLLETDGPDFLAVYLETIDTVSHLFVRDPRRGPQATAAAYEDADALLARLAAASSPETLVIVCSDHGFHPADAGIREDPADLLGPAAAWHHPYGLVAVAEAGRLTPRGPTSPAAASAARPILSPLDVAPTVLHAAGLSVPTEMPGRVAVELLPDELARRPQRRAPGPPLPSTARSIDESSAADARERLQALGYLGSRTTSLARQNLGEVLYRRGDLAGAEREMRAVVAAQPANLTALLWLAKSLRDQRRPREALEAYRKALALPGGRGVALVEAVEAAISAGLVSEAEPLVPSWPPSATEAPAVHTARAALAVARGQPAQAEAALRSALARDPASFDALSRLFDLRLAGGRARDTVSLARRGAARAPASARHQALLGAALLAAGDPAGAEKALRRALDLAPDGDVVRLDLARALVEQKRAREALAVLWPAPPGADRSVLLGAAHSLLGEWADAATRYRDALAHGPATPQLLNGLAWAELQRGRRAEAATLLDRSLAMRGDQAEIRRLRDEILGSGR